MVIKHWGYMLKLKNKIGGQGRGLNLACKSTPVYLCLAVILFSSLAHASTSYDIPNEKIVNAIYHAEGGAKTKYPYGIKSVPCEGEQACRVICFNTVRNNKKRFLKQTKYTDYIEFLASRYCPIGASDDPRGLNKNWVKNVRYFLAKGS